ncbi:hypothetical protein NPIL_562661 [Nephila pilipes]|uniref:Uncharacterized protein n=1 Tax=Nephila pilipes TaxID=299642 RepID=A0A8X6NSY9_NEPPI|nr:hypothetical protein NPIL_562661 [Nephila pilipes]
MNVDIYHPRKRDEGVVETDELDGERSRAEQAETQGSKGLAREESSKKKKWQIKRVRSKGSTESCNDHEGPHQSERRLPVRMNRRKRPGTRNITVGIEAEKSDFFSYFDTSHRKQRKVENLTSYENRRIKSLIFRLNYVDTRRIPTNGQVSRSGQRLIFHLLPILMDRCCWTFSQLWTEYPILHQMDTRKDCPRSTIEPSSHPEPDQQN